MKKSNEKNSINIMEVAKDFKKLTPRQKEVINNITIALYDVQEQITKVGNCEINGFVQALEKLSLRQLEVVMNLTNALYDVQKEVIKVKNCEVK